MNGMTPMYFKPFDTDVNCINAGLKWQEYLEDFDRFVSITGITDDTRIINMLLHFAGPEIVRIYVTLRVNADTVPHATLKMESDNNTALQVPRPDKYSDVCKKLTDHFNPKRSKMYERHVFKLIKQKPEEDIMSFVTRLRTASRYCEFHNVDDEIASQILSFGSSDWLTARAFQGDDEPTLKSIMKLMTTKEISSTRSKVMRNNTINHNEEQINFTTNKTNQRQQNIRPQQSQAPRQMNTTSRACNYCGKDSSHEKCPAADSTCRGCDKKGHWEVVCRSKNNQNPSQRTNNNNNKNNQRSSIKGNNKSRNKNNNRRDVNFANEADQNERYTEYNCFGVFQN